MIKLSDIQKFMVTTLKNSAEFSTYCTDNIGATLNFYRDSSVSEANESLPYFVAHKFNSIKDWEAGDEFVVQFVIAIEADKKTKSTSHAVLSKLLVISIVVVFLLVHEQVKA